MPPDRRRRRFRRPDTGRWLTETLSSLRIELASTVRTTLTAWMRLYGEANDVQGLATGPIETRFARLRENTAADTLIVWTTPGRWATGEGLSLRFPQLHLEFTCALGEGHLVANKVAQVTDDARPPDREPGAVGVVVRAERIPLPPEDADASEPDSGVDTLEQHFAHLAGRRWGGFAAPLSAALEAEAREDEARTQRLTVPFKEGSLTHGGEEDVWRLKGIAVEALRALDDGEWLEILDDEGRSRTSARVISTHPGAGTLVVGVRTASDPPRAGFVRPRSRRKILEQKRALLEELASPTGSLPNLVRLVAAPASMPAPITVRPPRFVNPAVVRNRSQARAVGLALGLEDGEALLIQGPPGTGKSTTAAEIDVQLILRDPGVRILVCSHSNHGTDNMLMKVLPFLEDAAERIARIGFYERIARDARPFYAGSDVDLGDRNIIFTTIDALVLQDVAGARVYDYVIVDEANRAGVLDSLLALARGRRMIMVGDPMQLQPVMSEAEQQMVAAANGASGRHGQRGGRPAMVGVAQAGAQHVIGKSLFAWIQERHFAPAATVLLDQQNRMHPAIGELVSRVFYSGHVRTGPAAPRRGTGLPAFPAPVTWVDTRALKGNVESRAGGTSLFNLAEARLVTSITTHLASHAPPNLTIGVITAYAEQRDLLRRLMGPHTWPADRQLEVDTVDAFEGREKDIIVLSLVRANRRRDIGFLRLEQRLNVAISRSRRLLIVVGDTSTLRDGFFGHLVATTQAVGQVVPAPKLIGQFLTRAVRPRRERDDRRREGMPEAPMAAQAGTETELSASAGVRIPPAAAAAGQEATGPVGSRRRRRRAWERRRERLRALHEQHQHGGAPGESDEPQPLGSVLTGGQASDAPPLDDAMRAAGTGAGGEAARSSEASPVGETTPMPRPRPRRHRRFGIPHAEEASATPIELISTTAQPADGTAADSPSTQPAPAASDLTPRAPAGPASPPPRRRRIRRSVEPESEISPTALAPEPTALAPEAAEPAPEAADAGREPALAPRARRARRTPEPVLDTPPSPPEPSSAPDTAVGTHAPSFGSAPTVPAPEAAGREAALAPRARRARRTPEAGLDTPASTSASTPELFSAPDAAVEARPNEAGAGPVDVPVRTRRARPLPEPLPSGGALEGPDSLLAASRPEASGRARPRRSALGSPNGTTASDPPPVPAPPAAVTAPPRRGRKPTATEPPPSTETLETSAALETQAQTAPPRSRPGRRKSPASSDR